MGRRSTGGGEGGQEGGKGELVSSECVLCVGWDSVVGGGERGRREERRLCQGWIGGRSPDGTEPEGGKGCLKDRFRGD